MTHSKAMVDRDTHIVSCYRDGKTLSEIADDVLLSKQRVHQILRNKGVTKNENPLTRSQGLYAYIGINVTHEVKDLATTAAIKQKLSLSKWIARLINNALGYKP